MLSNLILSVLREDPSTEKLIEAILTAAIKCPHRLTLLKKSQEFKPERLRLKRILTDAKKLGFKDKG